MNGKLAVKVALDLEGRSARISVRGRVDMRNVQALYSLAHRANALNPGFEITLDLTAATAEQEVLDALHAYASLRNLPRHVDPAQADCNLRIESGELTAYTRAGMMLAV